MSKEGYSSSALQVPAASSVNIAATCGPIGTQLTQPGSLAVHLTSIRGKVRRLPQGVKKEQFSLLAAMIENGVSGQAIKQQLALMAS